MTKILSKIEEFKPCCDLQITKEERELFVAVGKALGNEARLEILMYLSTHPGCMTANLVDYLPLAQSTISQHLKVLKDADIIEGEIYGPSTCYCIKKETINKYLALNHRIF